ncbi:MAG: acyl-CoA thioesterase [Vicinamibacteria bacterium]|nr:acyl-CoA thioesterase [Vicinamibacteria bacterium]
MNIASTRHEVRTRVEAGDIDQLGHVNNLVYLRWVQEAAISHWRVLASAEEQASVAWVVHRHEIDYLRPAFVGEAITLRTWVGGATPATFERLTEIVRSGDGQVLARARTLWCPIDPATGRLRRIDDGLRARASVAERAPSS